MQRNRVWRQTVKDLGQEFLEALSSCEGAQKATTTTLLLLVNALHVAEPERDQPGFLRSLHDGALPTGRLLQTLNMLSANRKTRRSAGPGDQIKVDAQPPNAAIPARSILRKLGLVFQVERCGLALRGRARDELVIRYLKSQSRPALNTYENLAKETHRLRKKFTGAGLFGDAAQTRDFVRSVLVAMLGPAATELLGAPDNKDNIARFREISARVHDRLNEQVPDILARDVLCALFDFSLHDDAQIGRTLMGLNGAPALQFNSGDLSAITADILPNSLFK